MKKNNNSFSLYSFAGSLIVDQFLAVMASFLLTALIGLLAPGGIPSLNILLSLFAYALICYVDSWNRGFSDANRIRLGILPNNKFRGALAGLVAAIPALVLALLAYLTETEVISIFKVFESDIMLFINRFWQLPFSAVFSKVNEMPALNFAFPFFLPIVSGFGYFLGVSEFTLRQIFVYTKNDQK